MQSLNPINIVKDSLDGETCLAVYNPQYGLYKFAGQGVKPLYQAIRTSGGIFIGAYAADKVIGRAAALLFVYARVKEVYAGLLSSGAAEIFERYNIPHTCGKKTTAILNRAGTDICPIEKLIEGCDEPSEARERLSRFFTA